MRSENPPGGIRSSGQISLDLMAAPGGEPQQGFMQNARDITDLEGMLQGSTVDDPYLSFALLPVKLMAVTFRKKDGFQLHRIHSVTEVDLLSSMKEWAEDRCLPRNWPASVKETMDENPDSKQRSLSGTRG